MDSLKRVLERIVEISIYGLVFIIPFSKAGIEIFGSAAIIGWVVLTGLRIKDKGLRIEQKQLFLLFKNPILVAVFMYFSANFMSCLMSVAIAHSFKALFAKTIEYLLFFFIIIDIFSKRGKLNILLKIILVSFSFILIDGLIQYFTGFDLVRKYPLAGEMNRINASFQSPNDFANYIILFIPILFVILRYINIQLRYRILTGILFLTSVFCLIYSYTRAAWLGFLISGLFICFVKNKKFIVYFLIILLIGIFLFPVGIKERLKYGDRTKKRQIFWQEAINIIKDYPIFGSGLNTYTQVAPKYKLHCHGGIYPHNSYLHIAAETGITGLAAFLWFLCALFWQSWKTYKVSIIRGDENILILGIMAGLMAYLVHAFFDTSLFAIKIVSIFWIMCGILMAITNKKKVQL